MNTIFITGAAAGIGCETARLFVANGWFVGLADRDQAGLARLAAALGAERCSTHVVDVTDMASVRAALADFAARTGGRLQVLHNNAGVLKIGPFEEIAPEEHRRIVDINIAGAINVLHAAFPYLKATPGAQVINMSSASAAYGIPEFASYSASKHAIRALTEALDIEWARHGIRVTDLMPPFVNTGMVQSQTYRSPIIEKLGVNLTPEAVAGEVWAQVQSPRLHRPLTAPFRALWPVARSMPAGVTRAILRRLSGLADG
ncbi:MAG: SDR family oxidoreductase [Pseudomonadota bacterium]